MLYRFLLIASTALAQPIAAPLHLPPNADLFAASTRAHIAQSITRACQATPPPNTWNGGPIWARELVLSVRRLSSEQTGKQIYLDFLKSTYGYNITALNTAYGVEAGSFTDLEGDLLTRVDLTRPAVQRDDTEFLSALAKEVFTVAAAGLRSCNKNATTYSEVFDATNTPMAVIEAAVKLVEVIRLKEGNAAEWAKKLKTKVEIEGAGANRKPPQ